MNKIVFLISCVFLLCINSDLYAQQENIDSLLLEAAKNSDFEQAEKYIKNEL